MRRGAVALSVSLALAGCSADEFATPDGGVDAGVDAPVVVDSGADARDAIGPPVDAPVDAPPSSWCLEPAQVSAEACADFDEGDITKAFSKGTPKSIACIGTGGGTAKLVSSNGLGQLELVGVSSVSAPDVACQLSLPQSTKNTYVVDFDVPSLIAGGGAPVTLASFQFDANNTTDCAFDLQAIQAAPQKVALLWVRNSVASNQSLPTGVSHLRIKVDYNSSTQELKVVTTADQTSFTVNYTGCSANSPRTTIFAPHVFSPPGNGTTTIRYDRITVSAL